jgi:UDP-glucose 4-epimerase
MKEKNMEKFINNENFKFIEGDLIELDLKKIIRDIDVVFHQAGIGGIRESWGARFDLYIRNNILATQNLLEACKNDKIRKFIFASSSSIYGDAESLPTKEDTLPKPVSPYGVSKLAGEHLCYLYWKSYNIPVISLRYFTVYGPRQRPDMAFHKFIKALINGDEIVIYGSGEQTRDFTYVADVVEANLLAMKSKAVGEVFNIGGVSTISINDVIKMIQKISGKKAMIRRVYAEKGEVKHTSADITKARKILGYSPKIGIEKGLRLQLEWLRSSMMDGFNSDG